MSRQEIIVIDSDDLFTQPAIEALKELYKIEHITDINHLDIKNISLDRTLFIIDPNSFQRKALKTYESLLQLGANVVVAVFKGESVLCESDCFDSGALDFICKPFSPSALSLYVSNYFRFMSALTTNGHKTIDFIRARREYRDIEREFVVDLVEDSPTDAQRLFGILAHNCDVRWYRNVEQFRQRNLNISPDIYILDLMVDVENDGFELLDSIKKDMSTLPTVLFLTGSWQRRKMEAGLKLGASDYIRKDCVADDDVHARLYTHLVASLFTREQRTEQCV